MQLFVSLKIPFRFIARTLRKYKLNIVNDYNVNNVSEKICNIILSYKDFINRVVWKNN